MTIGIGQIMAGAPRVVKERTIAPSAVDPSIVTHEAALKIIDTFAKQIWDLKQRMEVKVDADQIKSSILMSPEAILITSKNIGLLGDITMFDYIRDLNGQQTNVINDKSFTRVRGGVIQTGAILSTNWTTTTGSKYDLDAGTITLGGSSAPKFSVTAAGVMTCVDANVSGTLTAGTIHTTGVTIDGVTAGTVVTRATAGYNIQQALEVSGTTILQGVLAPTNTGAVKTGTITWNSSSGALTGGSGVAITEWGIIGATGGVATFTIDTSGNATFAGSLSAATGTFSGTVSAGAITSSSYINVSGYVKASGTVSYNGVNSCVVGDANHSGTAGYFRNISTGNAIFADSASGDCIIATSGSTGRALYVTNTGGAGYAIYATGPLRFNGTADFLSNRLTKTRVDGHLIKVYDTSTHALVGTYEFSFE